jgi:hypothetical protein
MHGMESLPAAGLHAVTAIPGQLNGQTEIEPVPRAEVARRRSMKPRDCAESETRLPDRSATRAVIAAPYG